MVTGVMIDCGICWAILFMAKTINDSTCRLFPSTTSVHALGIKYPRVITNQQL